MKGNGGGDGKMGKDGEKRSTGSYTGWCSSLLAAVAVVVILQHKKILASSEKSEFFAFLK